MGLLSLIEDKRIKDKRIDINYRDVLLKKKVTVIRKINKIRNDHTSEKVKMKTLNSKIEKENLK